MITKLFCRKLLTFGALCALLCSTFGAFAQKTRELVQEDDKKPPQKRVALVIGNAAYTKAKPLANPANDAADMSKALKELGFEVISGTNQNKRQMETSIREFGNKLASSGGVGLFYYAGHGIQVGGENYLIPVDADIPSEDEISYAAVSINLVLGKMSMAANELNIIILDACRNNPFTPSWRGYRNSQITDGLAKISPPTGTLVLYATEPGKIASDGTGRNGLFTEALLRQIRQPNLEYDQLVKAVSADVWQKSNRQQLPWKEGNSLLDFYFADKQKPPNVPANPIPNDKTNEPVIVAKNKVAQEKEAWDLVKNSNDADDFRLFLREFPNGANSEKAKIRLEELVWISVKTSNDKSKIQAYLNEFPSSVNAASARILLRQLETRNTAKSESINLIGTKWKFVDDDNQTSFITFYDNGKLRYENIAGFDADSSAKSSWALDGNIITIMINQYSTQIGVIEGNEMSGKGLNKSNMNWTFKAIRIE